MCRAIDYDDVNIRRGDQGKSCCHPFQTDLYQSEQTGSRADADFGAKHEYPSTFTSNLLGTSLDDHTTPVDFRNLMKSPVNKFSCDYNEVDNRPWCENGENKWRSLRGVCLAFTMEMALTIKRKHVVRYKQFVEGLYASVVRQRILL